ncbi:MAG: 2-phospho-L-lactate guanylyltransferase [Methanobacterium sp.]|nr:2-phospho-L-lactate guanylyltransferase [Methanobacterium sp.]
MKKTCAIIPVSRFCNAKTRLSPKLTVIERENLLKAMLNDVINVLDGLVEQIVIISSDEDVLNYVSNMKVKTLREKGETDLNGALHQAIDYSSKSCDNIFIVPSDVPLIQKNHVKDILELGKKYDVVIAPAKGGGTNGLLFPASSFKMKFGDYSFFEHINEAKANNFSYKVYDSFYLSLDVNTAEDLGEIMLHGLETEARNYLKKIHLKVKSNHGSERLNVNREVSA